MATITRLLSAAIAAIVLGTATLSLTSCDSPSQPDPTIRIDSINIVGAPARLEIGQNTGLSAVVLASSGDTVETTVVWSSSDSTIASVSQSGLVTARGPGSATITARAGNKSQTVVIAVVELDRLTCASPGGTTHGGLLGLETWRRADGPHLVASEASMRAGLIIEPGTLICAGPNARIDVYRKLDAQGTAERPIVFTAIDPTRNWRGIAIADTAIVRFARIEYAAIAIYGTRFTDVSHSHFRHNGMAFWSVNSRLAFSVIDSTTGAPTIFMAGGTLEENWIRDSQLDGIYLDMNPIRLLGGRITGSGRTGITAGGLVPNIVEARPLRVTGGSGRPFTGHLSTLQRVWPAPADQDSLRGNAIDSLGVVGTSLPGEVVVRAGLPWQATLTIASGTVLRVEAASGIRGSVTFQGGQLIATGSANALVTLSGQLNFAGAPPAPSTLTDVQLINTTLNSLDSHAVVLTRVTARGDNACTFTICTSRMAFRASGSRISDSEIISVGSGQSPVSPAIILAGDNIILERTRVRNSPTHGILAHGLNIAIRQCEVVDNGGDGIQVTNTPTIRINECNIARNAGNGVTNSAPGVVDARFNWWGDPTGPLGPAGDGVSGNVDFSGFRSAPIMFSLVGR